MRKITLTQIICDFSTTQMRVAGGCADSALETAAVRSKTVGEWAWATSGSVRQSTWRNGAAVDTGTAWRSGEALDTNPGLARTRSMSTQLSRMDGDTIRVTTVRGESANRELTVEKTRPTGRLRVRPTSQSPERGQIFCHPTRGEPLRYLVNVRPRSSAHRRHGLLKRGGGRTTSSPASRNRWQGRCLE